MKPAPPVTSTRMPKDASASPREAVETSSEPFAPVRQLRRSAFAAEGGVRGPARLGGVLWARDGTHAAVDPGLDEDRGRELGPAALPLSRHVVEAKRQLEDVGDGR